MRVALVDDGEGKWDDLRMAKLGGSRLFHAKPPEYVTVEETHDTIRYPPGVMIVEDSLQLTHPARIAFIHLLLLPLVNEELLTQYVGHARVPSWKFTYYMSSIQNSLASFALGYCWKLLER